MKSNEPMDSADELVQMIDALMQQGGGRVTVKTDESTQGIKVDTYVSTDCADGAKGACCQPNEKDEEFDASHNGKG